jgi:putative nucleotidyltransferase-like protein
VIAAAEGARAPGLISGRVVADILAGAWRENPPALVAGHEEIARVASLLIEYGAAALAWHRISREAHLREVPAAAALQQAYRLTALEATRKEAALEVIAELFGAAGLEPMIFKGWAVARHYPKPHLRPVGDIDLCVPPGQHADALALLTRHAIQGPENPWQGILSRRGEFILDCGAAGLCHLDLHRSIERFRLAPLERLYARAPRITFGTHAIRVPAAEDHLRLVAIHFLIHGGFRPLWLCDVGALVEAATEDFRWDICLGEEPRTAHWIACVFELARRLLGARLDRVPQVARAERLPDWLERTVVKEWQVPFATRTGERTIVSSAGRPWTLPAQVKLRWPNPIRATVAFGGRFDEHARARYQWAIFGAWLATGVAHNLGRRRSRRRMHTFAERS